MSVNSSQFSLFKRSTQFYYVGYYRGGMHGWKSTGVSTTPEALKVLTQFRELLESDTSSGMRVNVELCEYGFLKMSAAAWSASAVDFA